MKNNHPDYLDLYNKMKKEYELIEENFEYIPAEVIHQNIHHLNNLLIVNQGSSSGIKENSFVVNDKGLVGYIKKVFNNISVVETINSKNTSVLVEVGECYGVLRNSPKGLIIEDLIKCENIKINDPVFTSKYNYSSSNIFVGIIEKITKGTYFVKPSFNQYEVRYVGIINDNN